MDGKRDDDGVQRPRVQRRDNYVYAVSGGWQVGNNDLLQVGSDGSVVDLGPIVGLPKGPFYNNGTIVDGKTLLVAAQHSSTLYRVDLRTRQAVASQLSATWSCADFASSANPDLLWGVYGGMIQRLSITTGTVDTFVNPLGGMSGGSIATAPNGDLVFTDEGGLITQVHVDGAESDRPTFSRISSVRGPASSTADGTAIGERTAPGHEPFDRRTPTGFWVPSDPGASQRYSVDLTKRGAPATAIGSPWSGDGVTDRYNALSFDTASGYLYGITKNENLLVQVGRDGSVVTIGKLTNASGQPAGTDFFNNGTIVGGRLIAAGGGGYRWAISIDLKTAVFRQFSLSDSWQAADFASNDGTYLWGVYQDKIQRLEIATGRVTTFRNTVTRRDARIGGILNAPNGDFVVSDNSHGRSYRFHVTRPASATPTFTVVGTGAVPVTVDSDGTSTVSVP